VILEGDTALVIHRDPGRYNSFLDSNNDKIVYRIGRSMYETDRIPSNWISNCNSLVDKIWVPSHFNLETFTNSGVLSSQLEVVPEPIDTYTYDSQITSPIELPDKKGFNFLTIMKWEKRKGWDELLTAYFSEFTNEDDVSLYFRSNQDDNGKKEYEKFIKDFLLQNEDGSRTQSSLPQVVFLKESMPAFKLPSLYKSVDSFVLSSHGEGWGLPIAEAMALELPAISTNWSGSTEFMTQENSYLVSVESMVEAPTQGHLWAKPSNTGLRVAMRNVFENVVEARNVGRRARMDIRNFSVQSISQIVVSKLQWIEYNKSNIVSSRVQKKEEQKLKKKDDDEKKKRKKIRLRL